MSRIPFSVALLTELLLYSFCTVRAEGQSFRIVDTGQKTFYNRTTVIEPPAAWSQYWGQDAQFNGHQPSYTDNGDGTITDNVTGLMWQQSPDRNGDGEINAADKLTYDEAVNAAGSLHLAGYADGCLPTIKELYSLIVFTGVDPSGYTGSSTTNLVPFIDSAFAFGYGDLQAGERIIDAQFASATLYVGTVMVGAQALFGVNFADGRIKGYPTGPMPGQTVGKKFYVLYVRQNPDYGINDLVDNGDGTVTDHATGLMWTQADNGQAVVWEDALAWAQDRNTANYLGYEDWRLPNIKELQTILD